MTTKNRLIYEVLNNLTALAGGLFERSKGCDSEYPIREWQIKDSLNALARSMNELETFMAKEDLEPQTGGSRLLDRQDL